MTQGLLRLVRRTEEALQRREDQSLRRRGLAAAQRQEWAAWVERARGQRPAAEDVERAMGAALCYLRRRAAQRVEAMGARGPSAAGIDEAETDLRWAWWLAGALASAQSFVAIRNLEERLGAPAGALSGERARLAHEALEVALVRAALAFDPFKGGRGSRLAGVSTVFVTRAMQWLSEHGALEGVREGAARARGVVVEDVSWRAVEWSWLTAGPGARDRATRLPGEAREIIRCRWGLDGEESASEPPMTRRAVSARMHVGAARIARCEREWVRGHGREA